MRVWVPLTLLHRGKIHELQEACKGRVFSAKNVLRAKQMLAMNSESSQTPSLTPYMLLEAHVFSHILPIQ